MTLPICFGEKVLTLKRKHFIDSSTSQHSLVNLDIRAQKSCNMCGFRVLFFGLLATLMTSWFFSHKKKYVPSVKVHKLLDPKNLEDHHRTDVSG